MSFSATRWARAQPRLRGSRKAVLMELSHRANEDGICFPSLRRLAEDLGYGIRTMASAIQELLRRRFIVKVENRAERETLLTRAGARFVSLRVNVYRVLCQPDDVAAREAAEAELELELPHQRRPRKAAQVAPEAPPEPEAAAVVAPLSGSHPEPAAKAAKMASEIVQIRPVDDAILATESFRESPSESPPRNPPLKRGGRRARRRDYGGGEEERPVFRNGFCAIAWEDEQEERRQRAAGQVIDLQRTEWAAVP